MMHGPRLRDLRLRCGVGFEDVARNTSVGLTALIRFEKGLAPMREAQVREVVTYCALRAGASPEQLWAEYTRWAS